MLSFWDKDVPNLSKCSIEINLLSDSEVQNIIGADIYKNISLSIRLMIRNINILNMYMTLANRETINKTSDIVRKFIDEKHEEIASKQHLLGEVKNFHDDLVAYMQNRNSIVVPIMGLESKYGKRMINDFCSSGLIEKVDSQIKFSHQSILDFCLAKQLYRNIKSIKDIKKVLKKYNESALSNYEAIKQLLELLQSEFDNYILALDKVLFDKKICSYIRHMAFESFRTISNPKTDEIELFRKIIRNKLYGDKYLYSLTSNNVYFAKAFLEMPEYVKLNKSLLKNDKYAIANLLLSIINKDISFFEKLKNYCDNLEDNDEVLLDIIHQIDDIYSSDELFDYKLELLYKNQFKNSYIDWDKIIEQAPNRAGKYFRYVLIKDVKESCRVDWSKNSNKISTVIRQDYKDYMIIAVNYLQNFCSEWELKDYDDFRHDGIKKLASQILQFSLQYADTDELIKVIMSTDELFKHIALKSIIEAENNSCKGTVEKIILSHYILLQDFHYDRKQLYLFRQIFEKYADNIDMATLTVLINDIIKYVSPSRLEFAKKRFEQHKVGLFYSFFEEEQKVLLNALPYDKLNDATKNYVWYLNRKFIKAEYFNGADDFGVGECRSVVSGIAKKWNKFSEKTWKKLISNPKTGKQGRWSNEIDDDGNYVEYDRDSFCRAISTAANIKQKMFVHIALSMNNIPSDFCNAICSGLYESNDETRKKYQSGNIEFDLCDAQTRLDVYKKYYDITNKSFLHSFVWFIERNGIMDDWVKDKLYEIANNPERYEKELMNVWSGNWNHTVDGLTTNDLETEKKIEFKHVLYHHWLICFLRIKEWIIK